MISEGAPKAPPKREPVYTRNYLLLLASEVTVFVSLYVLLPVIPLYILDLGGTKAQVGFLLGVASVTGLVTTPLYGRAADRWGRKIVVLAGLIVNGVFSASLAAVHVVGALALPLVGRAAGSGASGTGSRTLVFDISPASRRGEAISTFLVGPNVAIAFGPALGLFLLHTFGFRGPFFVAAGLCLASAVLAAFVREPRRAAPASQARRGPAGGWLAREALFPSAVQLLLSMSYGGVISFLAVMGEQRGIGGYQYFFTAYAAVVIGVRVFGGRVSDRFGRTAVLLPSLCSQVVALVLLSVATSLPVLVVSAIMLGLGWGAAYPALTAFTADRVEPARRGTAMGVFSASFALGISLGTVIVGNVAERADFTAAFLSTAFLVVCALVLAVVGLRAAGELKVKRAVARA